MRKLFLFLTFLSLGIVTPAILLTQGPPPAQIPVVRKTIQTTDGKTLTGRVVSEGFSDLQLATEDGKIQLLRKTADPMRYRVVTSQRDWPSYHGEPGGNHYTTATQINKSNVARLG